MLSETPTAPSRWSWLRSQGLGVCCGLATTVLLAVGSIVVSATRDGASADVQLDDVRVFFERPSVVHLWFYLLLPVLALYGINTALATWHSVTTKWRNGVRQLQAYAPALIHVAFLVALLAHLVGGLGGRQDGLLIDTGWGPLPDGRQARLTAFDVEPLPDGRPKQMHARIELSSASGEIESANLAFNQPLSSGWGSCLVLLQRPVPRPGPATFAVGDEQCELRIGESCELAGRAVRLVQLRDTGAHGTLAQVVAAGQPVWLMQGLTQPFDSDWSLTLRRVESGVGVIVTWRTAPGNPWALAAALLLVAGVALMWRRLV